jgi:hypothetical protein
MPAKPPVPGVAKVTFLQAMAGRQFGDSLYFAHVDSTPWTVPELASLATGAAAIYAFSVLGLQDAVLTFVQADAVDLSDTAGRTATGPSGVGGGAAGTHPLSMNSVAHIALEVARRYRGGRPGYNISGLDETMMDTPRQFSNASVTLIQTAFDLLISDILGLSGLGGAIASVGVSYFLDKLARPVPLVEPIVANELQQRICSLRRRSGKSITL